MSERLQKYMARCGVASRRKSEELILAGRVSVNDKLEKELGVKVDGEFDIVKVDGVKIKPEEVKRYIMLNKPLNVLSTAKDERGRKTVIDCVNASERIYPIGRLDFDTSGLILLTNDGDIYNKLIHPRKEVKKVYIAEIKGKPTKEEIYKFCNGVDIGGYVTSNAEFTILKSDDNRCEVKITIHEGKNRQVRKMCDAINHPVLKLKRVSIGKIKLENLKMGQWRELTQKEIDYIQSL